MLYLKILVLRYTFLIIIFTACLKQPSVCTTWEIDHILSDVKGKSEKLVSHSSVRQLIKQGEANLSFLIEKFPDTTLSVVYSSCCKRYLTRGELAVIIADHIERMPYFLLTGIQNCTLTFCPDNPNNIEYYLDAVKGREEMNRFIKKYRKWVNEKK